MIHSGQNSTPLFYVNDLDKTYTVPSLFFRHFMLVFSDKDLPILTQFVRDPVLFQVYGETTSVSRLREFHYHQKFHHAYVYRER